jgi:uncharacterized protein (DUF983 family)
MITKGNKLYSIFKGKCPVCHEGEFFEAHPYNLKKAGDIYEHCSECGQKYSKEPGFYYGAMYVSYGIGVALFVTIWVGSLILGFELGIMDLFIVVSVALFVASPYLYALSKITWANIFMHYNKNIK